VTALGDDATVPKILNSLYEYRVGKGLSPVSRYCIWPLAST